MSGVSQGLGGEEEGRWENAMEEESHFRSSRWGLHGGGHVVRR